MPRKPINPNSINWDTVETTLTQGKSNFKILGKLTGVSASTIRRLMLSRYGTRITLKRGRAVGGVTWSLADAAAPAPAPVEHNDGNAGADVEN
jgi:hypothetical protein